MAVKTFLSSTYYYQQITENDMTTVATDIGTFLVSTCGWTDSGGGLYTSPTDAAGRWFDLLFTDRGVTGSTDRLEMRVRDDTGTTICTRRAQQSNTSSWDTRFYGGSHHFCIDFLHGAAAAECLRAGLLDLSPESQTAHTHYVWGNGNRTTLDAAANGQITYAFMLDNATAAASERCNQHLSYTSAYGCNITLNGSYVFRPCEMWCIPTGGGNNRYAGRQYQTVLVPAYLVAGDSITLPVDVGTNGTFTVLGGPGVIGNSLHAIRTA